MTNIEKYLHYYIGHCKLQITSGQFSHFINPVLTGIHNEIIFFEQHSAVDKNEKYYGNAGWDNVIPVMRRLENMPDEHVLELCELYDEPVYGDYRYNKWQVETYGKWDEYSKNKKVSNPRSDHTFTVDLIDGQVWLYEEGHLEPAVGAALYWQFYFENGYWIFGDQYFDKGLVIDAATLEPKKKLFIGDDKICPVTKKPCDDETCTPGAECNISGGTMKEGEAPND